MIGGTIHINEHDICTWEATNEGPVGYDPRLTVYAVELRYTTMAGYPQRYNFEFHHEHGKGAVALTADILFRAALLIGKP